MKQCRGKINRGEPKRRHHNRCRKREKSSDKERTKKSNIVSKSALSKMTPLIMIKLLRITELSHKITEEMHRTMMKK